MSQNALALLPNNDNWNQLKEVGKMAYKSGLLPTTIKNEEAATLIILKGHELGIAPMVALANMHVINNKVGISAEMLMAGIRQQYPDAEITFVESNEKICKIEAKRPKDKKASTFTFTIEEAKSANLINKDVWKSYPTDMLRARCITRMKRALFAEVMMGLSHTPEELEDIRDVTPPSQPQQGNPPPQGEGSAIKSVKNFAPQSREEAKDWKPEQSNPGEPQSTQQPSEGQEPKDVTPAKNEPAGQVASRNMTNEERKEFSDKIAQFARQAGYDKNTYPERIKALIGDKKFATLDREEMLDLVTVFQAEAIKKTSPN